MFKVDLTPAVIVPFIKARMEWEQKYFQGEIEVGDASNPAPMNVFPLVFESMVNEARPVRDMHKGCGCMGMGAYDLAMEYLQAPSDEEFLAIHEDYPLVQKYAEVWQKYAFLREYNEAI